MYALYEMSIGMGIYSSLATKTRYTIFEKKRKKKRQIL